MDSYPSLNQCLEKGPNLIELVPSSLNRFREKKIGVISDIKSAFLQIEVNKSDRDFLRFFWIIDGQVTVFIHCRVVFGLSCSPFLLSAMISSHLETAYEKAKTNNDSAWTMNSVKKLKESFYVDNCVARVDSTEGPDNFVREATAVMAEGGFNLCGWENTDDHSERENTLVLAMLWNKCKDTLTLNPAVTDIDLPGTITKRAILSATHKVFDPIGFTYPVSL